MTETKLTETIEASDGNTYEISVTYKNTAGIPMEGTALMVSELLPDDETYESYVREAAIAASKDAENVELSRALKKGAFFKTKSVPFSMQPRKGANSSRRTRKANQKKENTRLSSRYTNDPLGGAVFSLHQAITTGGSTSFNQTAMTGYNSLTTNASGDVLIPGLLAHGTYWLKEETPPNQYEQITGEVIVFTIDEMGVVTLRQSDPGFLTDAEGTDAAGTHLYTLTVKNELLLPSPTGLRFTYAPFLLTACAGMMLALIARIGRKRRKGKE